MEKNMREINPGLSAENMTKPEPEIMTKSELAKRIIEKINDFLKERQINGVEITKTSNKDVFLRDIYNQINITLDPSDLKTLTMQYIGAGVTTGIEMESRTLQETITRLGLCAELPRKVTQDGYQVFLGDMDRILYERQLKEIEADKDNPEKIFDEDRDHIQCALRLAFAEDKVGSLSKKMEQIKDDALNDLKKYAAQFIATTNELGSDKDQIFKISAPDMADYDSYRDPQINFFNLGPHLTPPINLSDSRAHCDELPPLMGLRGKKQKQASDWVGEKCIYTDEHFRLDDVLYPHLEKMLDLIKIDEEVKKRYLGYRVDSFQGRRNPQEKNIYSDLDINPLTQERMEARKNANDYLVKTIEMIRKQNKIQGLDNLSNTQ